MRTTAELQALIAEVELNIRDAQAAQSASTEGRSWTAQSLSDLRNQRTAYIREMEAGASQRAGGLNPMASRVTWRRT